MNPPGASPSARCARCDAPLPVHVLGGHCAVCLMQVAFGPDEPVAPAIPGRRLGNFEVIEEIGRGGMGVVYRARQAALDREVALKVLPGGVFSDPKAARQFRLEAVATARLQHPNLVAIHEVGEQDGVPYYAMDLVEGPTLAEVVAAGPVPARRAAGWVETVARAAAHAHEHRLVHRDIKPANILLDRSGQPRLVDFGLARLLDGPMGGSTLGQAQGSPAYMAPEQALARPDEVGPAVDIYSLGAVLYHLLTGRPPFLAESLHALLLLVRSSEPIAPRRLNPTIPADLETICLKCLEKSPGQRYGSAAELADDLARYLASHPIRARPVGPVGRLLRWRRRQPTLANLTAGVFLLLTLVAVGASVAGFRIDAARNAEHRAREREERANRDLRDANRQLSEAVTHLELQRCERFFRDHDASAGVAHLAELVRRDPAARVPRHRLMSALLHRNWALPESAIRHAGQVATAEFSPDGTRVLSASWDGTARIFDAGSGTSLNLLRPGSPVLAAHFSPDGTRVMTHGRDGRLAWWRSGDGAAEPSPVPATLKVERAELSDSGNWLATVGSDGFVQLWNLGTRTSTWDWRPPAGQGVVDVSLSRDGERIAVAATGNEIRLWQAASGTPVAAPARTGERIVALRLAPDGSRLAVATGDHQVRLWDIAAAAWRGDALPHGDELMHLAFDNTGQRLMTTSYDGFARLWNGSSGFPLITPLGHEAAVRYGVFATTVPLVATAGLDHAARVWDSQTGLPYCQPLRQREQTVRVAFDPGARRLVTASYDGFVQVWNLAPRRIPTRELPGSTGQNVIAFSPDGRWLASGGDDGSVRWWRMPDAGSFVQAPGHRGPVRSVEFSPDSRWVLSAADDRTAVVWDAATGKPAAAPFAHAATVTMATFSPDGHWVATGLADGTAHLWPARGGPELRTFEGHRAALTVVRFSPDGKWLVSGSEDRTARLWNPEDGQPAGEIIRHMDGVTWADFSPDSQLLVTSSGDNRARIWRVPSAEPVGQPLRHRRTVTRALFTQNGRRVLTVSLDRTARVWDALTGEALGEPLPHDSPSTRIVLSRDSSRVLTGGWNGRVRLWDTDSGEALTEWLELGGPIATASMEPSGEGFAAAAAGGVRLWHWPEPPAPVPPWFPEFAEAVAGLRLTAQGQLDIVPRDRLMEIARRAATEEPDSYYGRVVSWFVADPERRSPSPFR